MDYILTLLPVLLKASVETLKIFALTLVCALPLGLLISLGSISRIAPVRWLAKAYVWILRGTPLMLQLFFVYFGLPHIALPLIGPLVFNRFTAAVVAFVLNYAAYFAEIYRGGIESIDQGQHEAAQTLGFTRIQTLMYIIIPQTVKRIIPPISNETITLVKDTALVYSIGVAELLKAAKDAVNRDVNTTAFFVAAVIYLIITFILTLISRKLEKKMGYYGKQNNNVPVKPRKNRGVAQ